MQVQCIKSFPAPALRRLQLQAREDASRRTAVISFAKAKGGKGGKGNSDDGDNDSGKGKGKGDAKGAGGGADLAKVAADTKKDAVSCRAASRFVNACTAAATFRPWI